MPLITQLVSDRARSKAQVCLAPRLAEAPRYCPRKACLKLLPALRGPVWGALSDPGDWEKLGKQGHGALRHPFTLEPGG